MRDNIYSTTLCTLKKVAQWLDRPPHRIIHLCESGVIEPSVDARGRGTMRRFSIEQMFRAWIALDMQSAGIAVPTILPLMAALDRLMRLPAVPHILPKISGPCVLADLTRSLATPNQPVMAWLCPPHRVTLVCPKADRVDPHERVPVVSDTNALIWCGVGVIVNLTMEAEEFAAREAVNPLGVL